MNNRRTNPFINALRGILAGFRSERNFLVHLVFAFVSVVLGIWMGLTVSEWRWIALCIALVFAVELVNTAIETVVDLATPDYHPLAKKAKDAAAGAVLIAAIFAAVVGISIFFPKLWTALFG